LSREEEIEVSGQSISNFKTQLKELIYSLFSIAPSRNSISRLIMLLPLDEKIANQMYPELADRHMMEYLRLAIGLKRFDSNIEMGWDTLAVYIRDFIGNLFEVLKRTEVRAALTALLGDSVPNLEEEWITFRIKSVINDRQVGKSAKDVIKTLLEVEPYEYRSFEELISTTSIEESELRKALSLMEAFKLIDRKDGSKYRLKPEIKKYEELVKELVEG